MSIAWCDVQDMSSNQVVVSPCLPTDSMSTIITQLASQENMPAGQLVLAYGSNIASPTDTIQSLGFNQFSNTFTAFVEPTVATTNRGNGTIAVTISSPIGTSNFGQNTNFTVSALPGPLLCNAVSTNGFVLHGAVDATSYQVSVTTLGPHGAYTSPSVTVAAVPTSTTSTPSSSTSTSTTTSTVAPTSTTVTTLPTTGTNDVGLGLTGGSALLMGTVLALVAVMRRQQRRRL